MTRKPIMRLLSAAGLALLTVGLVFLVAPRADAAGLEAKVLAQPKPLAAFSLEDHRGRAFGMSQLEGRWSLVMLGFTQCPDVCPFTLQNLALVLEELSTRVSPARLPQVVFVAVDPERDRPVLGDYVKQFNDAFIGITGSAEGIRGMVDSLDGYIRFVRAPGSDAGTYQVQHSAIVSVVDPQGRIVATMSPPMEPAPAAELLAGLIRRFGRESN